MKHRNLPPRVPDELARAALAGDLILSEADYLRLREIAAEHPLADELDRAIVVPADRMPDDVVTLYSRCTYVDESAAIRREVVLVTPEEADPAQGRISVLAPVGSALLGLAVGRAIEWRFPDQRMHRLRVEEVC